MVRWPRHAGAGKPSLTAQVTLRKTPSSAVSQLAPQIKDRKKTASEKHDRSHSWGGAHTTSHGMTDTELRSLSDTNLNAHGGPRAPRDPLLEKDKRLEKVRHLLCRGSRAAPASAKRWEGGR